MSGKEQEMPDDRMPWFPCEPTKLLGALTGMGPEVAYTYWIVCLRIYEIGGPCPDSADTLARRTGYDKRVITRALKSLVKDGKLVMGDGGIVNPYAEAVLADMRTRHDAAKSAGEEGARRRWKKPQSNQSKTDSEAMLLPLDSDAHLHQQVHQQEDKKGSGRERAQRLPDGWVPSDRCREYAAQPEFGFVGPSLDRLAEAFCDHHRSKGNRMVDWEAAFRTWVRNEVKFRGRGPGSGPSGGGPRGGGADVITMADIASGKFRRTQ